VTLLRRNPLRGFAAAIAALGALYLALAPPALDRSRSLSVLILARDGSILRGFLTADGKWRLPVGADSVDPLYRRMLIAAEDQRFGAHPGVDPLAALRALGQLATEGRVVSGASTLTMQAVRLLKRRPRTFTAKLAEMGEALALQRRLGSDEILGLYLTLAPFGGNLEGVRAASLAYFGKEPARLSAAEAALLVAIPRSPEHLRPDRHPEAAQAARNAVLRRMAAQNVISMQTAVEAESESVPPVRLALPFHAPHLARALREAEPEVVLQRTTIDPLLQRQVEALLSHEVTALDAHATLAAIVIENRERRVLAHVGNAVFAASARRGTLDMTRAVRSPGSALKPFIYAMAFDRLIIHPETMLDDRRRYFGDYAPSDFDGHFQGEVSAREALQYSLNVPAVDVLEHLGPGRFVSGLTAAGIRLHLPQADPQPGLAIALGGVGISLTDLATLYAALPNGGTLLPLRYRPTDPPGATAPLFGPVAAWDVNGILAAAPVPPGILPVETRHGRPLAFKTGTSYGFRDAWAIGYDRELTIGVWAGRPDGTPMPGRSGRLTAAPLLFKIADLLGSPTVGAAPGPAPEGALVAARRDLPPGLRRLDAGPFDGSLSADVGGPKILYPPDGSVVAWDGQEIPLEAASGHGPLRWLVDGRPLPPAPQRRTLYWLPSGLGFARLTVIDAEGRSARANVRLMP
jgi:penicillin-binding protein 1C